MIGPVREKQCLFAIYLFLGLLLIIKQLMMDEVQEIR